MTKANLFKVAIITVLLPNLRVFYMGVNSSNQGVKFTEKFRGYLRNSAQPFEGVSVGYKNFQKIKIFLTFHFRLE